MLSLITIKKGKTHITTFKRLIQIQKLKIKNFQNVFYCKFIFLLNIQLIYSKRLIFFMLLNCQKKKENITTAIHNMILQLKWHCMIKLILQVQSIYFFEHLWYNSNDTTQRNKLQKQISSLFFPPFFPALSHRTPHCSGVIRFATGRAAVTEKKLEGIVSPENLEIVRMK